MNRLAPLLILVFAVTLALAMLAFWPLRAGLGAAGVPGLGLSARDVSGTIWSGSLQEAALGAQPLGDVSARLHLFPLLAGETHLSLDGEGAFRGVFRRRGDRLGVEALDLSAPFSVLGLPGGGTVGLSQVTAAFDGPRCAEASGRVRLDGLAGSGWAAPPLDGVLACDDGRLVARLTGRDAAVELAADMAFDRTGRWTLDLVARPSNPLVAAALAVQGFQPGPQGLVYSTNGRIAR